MKRWKSAGRVARGDRRGAALAFVTLVMLALLALAHGALVAALSERAVSRAAVRELELRAAAGIGLRRALAQPPGAWMESVSIGLTRRVGAWTVGGLEVTGSLRRLGRESWLVAGTAERGTGGPEAREVRLVWSLDPLDRVRALRGAASVGAAATVSLAGEVDAAAPAAVESPLRPEDCDPWLAPLAAHYAGTSLAEYAPLPDGDTVPALGLLGFAELSALPAVTVSGAGTPGPVETLGACREDEPWSWGDPDQPWRPCGRHLALRAAEDGLAVRGGVGQGLLVADGDVTFEAGARYYGLVIARGTVSLEGGAQITGMVLAGGGLTSEAGTLLRASACWAVRSLAAHRERGGSFVPLLDGASIGPT